MLDSKRRYRCIGSRLPIDIGPALLDRYEQAPVTYGGGIEPPPLSG